MLGPLVGFPFDTTLAVARMCFDGLLRDFPDIRWVIGHLGGAIPYLMERLDNGFRDFAECRAKIDELPSTYLKRLYYDTVTFSPYNARHGARSRRRGPHGDGQRLPAPARLDRPRGLVDRGAAIPEHEKERIFSGTALGILNNVKPR